MKIQFLQFIQQHCKQLVSKYSLKQSPFFDAQLFHETMLLMENYYKLDPKLSLMVQRAGNNINKL